MMKNNRILAVDEYCWEERIAYDIRNFKGY